MEITNPQINDYCARVSSKPSQHCELIEKYTRDNLSDSVMLTGPLVGEFLQFLIRITGAKRALEFGTYTGYSALCMAEALPADGEMITLDLNPETTEIAKGFWAKSPDGKKIRSFLGEARSSVDSLKSTFDFVFIDADKEGYVEYLKASLQKLSPNGIIVADNCLWDGKVLDVANHDSETEAIREFNEYVHRQRDLESVLIPLRDGLRLIRRK
jgi:caffeoyl-CoA O-methyltransferase